MIDITVYRDEGPVVGSRGTPVAVTNFNMKNSAVYTVAYFATAETTGAPLIRPTLSGDQRISFPVYTFFKINGASERIKNLRFKITLESSAQADKAQLFYKNTNVYAEPTATYDGSMMLMADAGGTVLTSQIYPNISTSGPHLATSRQTVYTGGYPYYTNYFVTQMRVNKGSLVGNTAQFKLRFEAYEFEV